MKRGRENAIQLTLVYRHPCGYDCRYTKSSTGKDDYVCLQHGCIHSCSLDQKSCCVKSGDQAWSADLCVWSGRSFPMALGACWVGKTQYSGSLFFGSSGKEAKTGRREVPWTVVMNSLRRILEPARFMERARIFWRNAAAQPTMRPNSEVWPQFPLLAHPPATEYSEESIRMFSVHVARFLMAAIPSIGTRDTKIDEGMVLKGIEDMLNSPNGRKVVPVWAKLIRPAFQ